MTAGTSSIRMIVASTRMAATMPTPKTLMKTWSLGMIAAKTTIMMAAAAVITRPVLGQPGGDGPTVVPRCAPTPRASG